MSRLRQKTKHLIWAGLAGAAAMGLIFTGYAVYQGKQNQSAKLALQQKYEAEIETLQKAANRATIRGWVPASEIPAGHPIKADDMKEVELPANSVPADAIKSREDIAGKIAKITLRPFTLLTETLLYEEAPTTDDMRWREMSFVLLPAALKNKDVVDIRIQFPTGQDYILLSKKKIEALASGTMTVTLGEAEILSLSSAIVDAYLHKASIYALTYVEPYLQDKSTPTYPANGAVMQLIKKDPNIVREAENALNAAARERLESDLVSMSPRQAAEFASSNLEAQETLKNETPAEEDSFQLK
ncbi:SAF domain-containing protein [Paenibacillus macerans]|uniref:SAF domain-containing protein n=1 Tax=Paenibacillus macerans TaxID=44252 RepID=UPI00203B5A09|nr:SAF domain-containing protein [Paenibacillus macerans]MCM3702738.1 SAF domain-containing protein [Paenibacillus macerans]